MILFKCLHLTKVLDEDAFAQFWNINNGSTKLWLPKCQIMVFNTQSIKLSNVKCIFKFVFFLKSRI